MSIRKVWFSNLAAELHLLNNAMFCYNFVSMDTEFPGYIRTPERNAPDSVLYNDLKHNVEKTKLIQLGITLSNGRGEIAASWEFNFSDFDVTKDPHNESSISLLKSNGIKFEMIKRHGIPIQEFAPKFFQIMSAHRNNLIWVTYHGLYDMAYICKSSTATGSLPESLEGFVNRCRVILGSVLDIKVIAKHCAKLGDGKFGLSKIAKILEVERIGGAHNAGSDSLLTAAVFTKMKSFYRFDERMFEGFIYGINLRMPNLRVLVHRQPCFRPVFFMPPHFGSVVHGFLGQPVNTMYG